MKRTGEAHRIVSLIPSVTDSIFTLGMGDTLIGVTDFCPIQRNHDDHIIRLGGPKSIAVEKIITLSPDLIITNKEENDRQQLLFMMERGLNVWVSTPKSVKDTIEFLYELKNRIKISNNDSLQNIQHLENLWETSKKLQEKRDQVTVFCPVWYEQSPEYGAWWMTFNSDTYCHDVLSLCGAQNVFFDRKRKYPFEADLGLSPPVEIPGRDMRYPRVTAEEISLRNPEIILLPDDPFVFSDADRLALMDAVYATNAVAYDRILRIDGTWISWYGTRTARALAKLPVVLQNSCGVF